MPDDIAHVPVSDLANQICKQVAKKCKNKESEKYQKDISLLLVDLAGGIINDRLNEIIPAYKGTLENMEMPFPNVWAHITVDSDPATILDIKRSVAV